MLSVTSQQFDSVVVAAFYLRANALLKCHAFGVGIRIGVAYIMKKVQRFGRTARDETLTESTRRGNRREHNNAIPAGRGVSNKTIGTVRLTP
jgi:hypothetical protein